MFISDTHELQRFVQRARKCPAVGIDTEFMRERTYFARLCLIQAATDDEAVIIDPLSIEDLTPLNALLTDRAVVKILHSGSQDLEIFYRAFGKTTAPVFDTQVAATLAGFPQQVGYGPLVHEMLGEKIDKGDTYSDWAKRPLTDTQIAYALNDVRYLPELHRRLLEGLKKDGRLEWLTKDFAKLEDESTYMPDLRDLWRRVKRVSSLNKRGLALAREVTAWREAEAMRRDLPKRWVLGDDGVVEIARRAPTTAEALAGIRGVSDKLSRSAVKGIIAAVEAGLAVPEEDLPSLPKRRRVIADVDGAVDLMIAIVRRRAKENGVAMPLLASRDDLERLAAGDREGHRLLEGWRLDMVGKELLDLLEGRVVLRISDGELVVGDAEAK